MIREFDRTKEEESRIMTIWLTAAIKAHPFIARSYWMRRFDAVKNNCLPFVQTYVYIENDRVVGFISVKDGGFIGALFVDVRHQRRGIGSALMHHVQALHSELALSVYKRNIRAVAFYKKVGFIVQNEHTDIDTGEQEYLMRWRRD